MARLPYRSRADLPPEQHDLLARDISLNRALANSPAMLRAFQVLARHIRHGESDLDPRLRELAILQVGWTARSPYEWSHHVKIGFDFGVSEADIRAIMNASADNALSALDRLVLRAAQESTESGRIDPATFDALRQTLSDAALTDLIVILGVYAGVVRILASLEIDVEPEYQPYLDRFPLPESLLPNE